ncbi:MULTISPECIES: ChaB family protein [unclassified Coleofasciculus]|uniref:ChaB family protein n=1 Tax=unclassified Coleofasciculus TaxID=2692782 RepID=UPI00187FF47C|nr:MULTISPECIES: ChaB family protein [unclassified Coleofasciculus]MBE9125697.1 ChaB family protein [Coleofasciculus sp. LEGE 07081]MBE9148308.1 ChaB family protein [Coleofasciculus sp. LEGE 07092]
MADEYRAERTVSAVFKKQEQVDGVVRRLMERGVPQDHISVMGKNFQSQTRIAGFISKKDVILGGLRTGAVFGSLFGSILSLLSGVGVLFIPFVGPVVAAGPVGAVLLGAASGALAGSAGAGLVSVFVAMGMPEEKATVYQTRLEAGEFLVMAEVPAGKSGQYQLLMESAGGEEVHTSDMTLPRPCPGKCNDANDLSPEVRSHLSEDAQRTFIERYNTVYDENQDPIQAEQAAWEIIHQQYEEDENGVWSKQKVTA